MPKLVQRMFPKRVWAFPNSPNTVFLTFDDGPIPGITPWVLDTLKAHNAKATFFCIGNNIRQHPDIFKRIISEGHKVCNHSHNHLNGWKTDTADYVDNVDKATDEMNKFLNSPEVLNSPSYFRPPYGKITQKQASSLQKKGYTICMWDVLSFDFDASISEEKCFRNVKENISNGSIIVFHDSLKAEKNLRYTLPKILDNMNTNGWSCKAIEL